MSSMSIQLLNADVLKYGLEKHIETAGITFIDVLAGMIIETKNYAVNTTHVDTGTLQASHYAQTEGRGQGTGDFYVRLQPLRNPKNKLMSTAYAGTEHGRGGEHAFYAITLQDFMIPHIDKELKGLF